MKRVFTVFLIMLLLSCAGQKIQAASLAAEETAGSRDCLGPEETETEEESVEILTNGAEKSVKESLRKARDYGLLLSYFMPKHPLPEPPVSLERAMNAVKKQTDTFHITVLDGVNYAAVYNYEYYVNAYPDVAAAFGDDETAVLRHFINVGMPEGRRGNDVFDVRSYRNLYLDLRQVFRGELRRYYYHYIEHGIWEGRQCAGITSIQNAMTVYNGTDLSDIYDFRYYVSAYADIQAAYKDDDVGALIHFATAGILEGRKAKETFDENRYAELQALLHIAAPRLLSLQPIGPNHMQLTWQTVDGADGYIIYRMTSGGWAEVGSVNSGGTGSFTESGLNYGGSYTYTVRAFKDKSKRQSGPCDRNGISAVLAYSARYEGGYKLYYDAAGRLIRDVDLIIGWQSSYRIEVYREGCVTTVYAKDGGNGYIIPVKSFICSPGTGGCTPVGTFYTPEKYRWKYLNGGVVGQWSTRIVRGILFHTIYYSEYENPYTMSVSGFNALGTKASAGCIRLAAGDAKWIYDHCPLGTEVAILYSDYTGPFGKPSRPWLPSWHTWDPTDPNCRHLCEKNNCH